MSLVRKLSEEVIFPFSTKSKEQDFAFWATDGSGEQPAKESATKLARKRLITFFKIPPFISFSLLVDDAELAILTPEHS